eukprot:TRINITY_DN6623_c0_g2_i3.p1 TRINITY_DN6623_c0_g2~~TRINITY_DN6623_c0_g2_i3.p1  ORF type:complete len:196 (+),score=33.47 TRINITY_DN6623_c0_g2_i3:152-739(+)
MPSLASSDSASNTNDLKAHKPLSEPRLEAVQAECSAATSDLKYPKFRRSILAREANTQMKAYMKSRIESLKNVLADLKGRSERVSKKRELLEDLINRNTEYSMRGNVTQVVNDEVSTLKLMVCKNPAYLEIVNSYVFANKRLGWKIPIDRPFMHLPWLDFALQPYPLLFRVEVLVGNPKKIDMSSTLTILSNDLP